MKQLTPEQIKKIVCEYVEAVKASDIADEQSAKALNVIGIEVDIVVTGRAYKKTLDHIIELLIGESMFEWVDWWIYETNHGTKRMEFMIKDHSFDPTQMDFEKFYDIVSLD